MGQTEQITTRVNKDEKTEFRVQAAKLDTNMSTLLRALIVAFNRGNIELQDLDITEFEEENNAAS